MIIPEILIIKNNIKKNYNNVTDKLHGISI